MKTRQRNEMDAFEGIFFAFNKKQLKEGLEKVGLKETETNKIYSIGSGGFVLKEKADALKDLLFKQGEEQKERFKNEKILIGAIEYELWNHEYSYTRDVTPALDALGLTEEEIDPKILKKAIANCKRGG